MEGKRILKLKKTGGLAKRTDFPVSFEDLQDKAKEFIKIDENFQKYQFIDENTNREIRHQEDFDLMDKEYENEKTIKISVNIIDKPIEISDQIFSSGNLSIKKSDKELTTSNENSNININLDEIKIEEPEDKMKREIQEIVNNKMKDLEENIAKDIFQSIKLQLSKNEQDNSIFNNNNIIHSGIKCNKCNTENIQGIRYKCINCQNYNLCQNCESDSEHISSHIFLKIRKPLLDEEYNEKIKNYNYKNGNFDYFIKEKLFVFPLKNKEIDNLVKQITLINCGEDWQNGAVFKCLNDSEIKGKNFNINKKVNKNEDIKIDIIFEDLKKNLSTFKDEYDVYYQMFNENNEAFGDITKFKVIFKD